MTLLASLDTPEAVLAACQTQGVRVRLDGDTIRLKGRPPLPPAIVEGVKSFKPELLRLLSSLECSDWLADAPRAVPRGDTTVSPDAPRPEIWRAGAATLDPSLIPADFSEAHWRAAVESARRLSDEWGHQLAALGWDSFRLFGCHRSAPWARVDCAGLALMLRERTVKAVKAEIVALETANGARQTFRVLPPSSPGETVLLWQLQGQRR